MRIPGESGRSATSETRIRADGDSLANALEVYKATPHWSDTSRCVGRLW